jgi:hypothetical protein
VAKAEENLLLRSQDFTTSWVPVGLAVTANSTAAPDGTTTAELVTLAATNTLHYHEQSIASPAAGSPYTISLFVKAGTHNFFSLGAYTVSSTGHWFAITADLSTGTITKTGAGAGGTYTSSSITLVGNGWYRLVVTGSIAAGPGLFIAPRYEQTNNPTYGNYGLSAAWTAAGTETMFLWGAQLEQRSSVTAYTATTTAPITNYIPALQTAAAGVARFEHNPVTGESLGLEIEEQRTNLAVRSEEFDNASWGKVRASVVANTIVAPDGTLTGDKLVEDTQAGSHAVQSPISTIASAVHTGSCYLKAGERTWGIVAIGAATTGLAYFDLVNGTVGTTTAGFTAAITPVGNGWYRCTISGTIATSNQAGAITVYTATANNTGSYTGNGFSGIYIWGAQLEAGAFPTSYIPTVASQVTRSADRASMNNIGSLLNPAEGTLYVAGNAPAGLQPSGNASGFVVLSDGTNNNRVRFTRNGLDTNSFFSVISNGATQASISVGSVSNNSLFKVAGAYRTNDFAASLNASSAGVDTLGLTVAALNTLDIGHQGGTALTEINSFISKIAYYPRRVTNAELQGMTTV